jgi:hypothetical protein
MVHALEKAASCLKQGGVILEVHDLVDPPRIEVHSEEGEFFAGQLFHASDFGNQRQADQALNHMVTSGKLESDQTVVFENYIRADSLSSLVSWLQEEWENAYLPEETQENIVRLVSAAGEDSEVVLRMISRLILFRPK